MPATPGVVVQKAISPPETSRMIFQRSARETLWISPDQSSAEGRWFWGEYQEFGFDVKLSRASSEPTLISTASFALKAGGPAQLHIYGDNLPASVVLADLDLGAGVKATKIGLHTKTELVADVDIAKDAIPGKRDLGLGRSVLQNAFAIYDKVDYLKVTPETALARLGSDVHPKGYQQFEAIGFNNGADGKSHTADDVELGPVDVNWTVEEFMAVYGDDDKKFVGNLSETAFFTPASDGPNPERKFSRNNYGDVWVVATAKNEKDKDGKPLTNRVLSGGNCANLYQVGSARGQSMTATENRTYRAGEFHGFEGGSSDDFFISFPPERSSNWMVRLKS